MADVWTTVGDQQLSLSNLDKVLFAEAGWTKAEVINYYLQIAPVMLPHITDRAVTRIRFPDGVGENALQFYEKNLPPGCPDWVGRQPVRTSEGVVSYVTADDAATLVYLANLAALELHVPQWSISSATPDDDQVITLPGKEPIESDPLADRIVVDCDPGPGITMIDNARAAMIIAAELAGDGLIPVAKTSGNKGLQVSAAIAPAPCEAARAYVHTVAVRLAQRHKDLFVVQVAKAVRANRIFLDYNQNMAARNTIAPYSLRARPSPRVATPLTWDEVAEVDDPQGLQFTPEQVLDRIEEHGDLAEDLLIDDPPLLP
ncbi:non-homologous end-joining DNA ligase [Propionibacteriaceae bacterium Y1685]|uniref:non-homologous end-joining DNA ligase n=1 Tax=Microlunatus sp. Y1700 TaxID=3418487 RepID=UPI003B824588